MGKKGQNDARNRLMEGNQKKGDGDHAPTGGAIPGGCEKSKGENSLGEGGLNGGAGQSGVVKNVWPKGGG